MPSLVTCSICGQTLPSNAPQGLCPACLLHAGVPTTVHPAAGGTLPFVPPTLAELAPHFPQLEIIELVGQGGMGAVYRARQPKLDRLVALKILSPQPRSDPGFAERFTREARALARLNHPNIVAVHDFGQAGAFHFLLMEFVDGVTLRHLIQTRPIEPREALAIVPPICDALQYAHDRGIVHRDIKPENILLDKNGAVKIADFGLAKLTGLDAPNFRMTSDRDVMGTPHYMAPEQVERPLAVDHRADIYSLGVVFYQMLTGELPLGRFAPPSQKVQIDVRLDEVVLRALQKEPEQRYQQATGLKTAVESVATSTRTVARQPTAPRPANGIDYRSRITLFGLPLLHIATGVDPATGKWRSAKGIVAIGHAAFGVIAIGGMAFGGIAIGGSSFGVLAIGGTSLGIVAIGGMALGGLFAAGGVAVATVATGGTAYGYLALGSMAFGGHAIGNNVNDPVAREFFAVWAGPLVLLSGWLTLAAIFGAQTVSVAVGLWGRRQSPTNRPWARRLRIAAWSAGIAGLLAVNSMALHIWWGAQSEIGARLAFFTSASAAAAQPETPDQFVQVQAWLVEYPAELKLTAENFDRRKLAATDGVTMREFLPHTSVRSGGTLEQEVLLTPAGPSVRFLLSTLRRRDSIRCAVRATFSGGGVSRIGFERSERVPPEEPLILELGSFTPGRKHAAVFRFQSSPTGARRNPAAPESPATTAPAQSPTAVSAARGNASGPPASASAADFDGMESNPEILRIQLRHAEIERQRAASRAAAGIVSESEAQRAADRVSLLRAKLDGNRRRFAQIQVDSAERNFRDAGQRRNAGFANDTELESLAADLEIARIRLRAEDARAP